MFVSYIRPCLSFRRMLPFVVHTCSTDLFFWSCLAKKNILFLVWVRSSLMKTDLRSLDDFKFFRHFISLILTDGSDRRTIICLGFLCDTWGPLLLPTQCDLMTSSGLWSGSISDIILRTAVVVSSPVARSDKPEILIKLRRPYCWCLYIFISHNQFYKGTEITTI